MEEKKRVTKEEFLELLERTRLLIESDKTSEETKQELFEAIAEICRENFPETWEEAEREERREVLRNSAAFQAALAELKKQGQPEKIISVICDKLGLPVSKVAKNAPALLNGEIDGVKVASVKGGKPVLVNVMTLKDVALPERITKRDCYINTVCASLLEAGNSVITPEMIYRTLNGLPAGAYVSPQAVAAITRSINKQRLVDVQIDCSEQAKLYGLQGAIFRGYMLPCDVVEVETANGYKKTAYRLLKMPPIYEYSKAFKHIRTIPAEITSINALRGSDEITTIKFYLLEQIESMRGNGRNNTMLYNTIFTACEIETNGNRTLAKRYRDYIKQMLAQWQEQQYISGWRENKKGQSFESVTIEL